MLSGILTTGTSEKIINKDLGEITIDAGETGKAGYGLKHIIEQRYFKDKMNETDITALLYLVKEAAATGVLNTSMIKGNDKIGIEKDGITAIVRTDRDGIQEKWILSGYALNSKKKEAAVAIQTVSAQYGYAPEFSGFRKQVGAVLASLFPSSVPPNEGNKNTSNANPLSPN